jgi:hypothetical protein
MATRGLGVVPQLIFNAWLAATRLRSGLALAEPDQVA